MVEAPNIKKNGKMDPNDILTFRVNNTKPKKIVICYFDKMVAITADRLERWLIFFGDVMVMIFFSKRCDTDIFGHTLQARRPRFVGL